MAVGDRQAEFGALARRAGWTLTPRVRLTGVTDSGHLGLPRELDIEARLLATIFDALHGDATDLSDGPHRPLVVDWYHEPSETVIEVDEYQHFTSDRLETLALYPDDLTLGFDRTEYVDLCHRHRQRADRYRWTKEARGLRRAGGRRAQRAYFDAVRDIVIPALGFGPVVRIPVLDDDVASVFSRYREHLATHLGT